jgi:hypothetical protein
VPSFAESSFFFDFCFIWIGQSRVVSISVCSGFSFQPAHCIVSLKNLTVASMFSSVLRGTFRVSLHTQYKKPKRKESVEVGNNYKHQTAKHYLTQQHRNSNNPQQQK